MILPGIEKLLIVFDTPRAPRDWEKIHFAIHGKKPGGRSEPSEDGSSVASRELERVPFHVAFRVWPNRVKGKLHWHLTLHRNPNSTPPASVTGTSRRVGWLEQLDTWIDEVTNHPRALSGRCVAQFEFNRKKHGNVFGVPGVAPWNLPALGARPELVLAGVRAGKKRISCEMQPHGRTFMLKTSQPLAGRISGIIRRAQVEARKSLKPFLVEGK